MTKRFWYYHLLDRHRTYHRLRTVYYRLRYVLSGDCGHGCGWIELDAKELPDSVPAWLLDIYVVLDECPVHERD